MWYPAIRFLSAVLIFQVSINSFSQVDTTRKSGSDMPVSTMQQPETRGSSQQPRVAPSTLPDISVIGDFRSSYDMNGHFEAGIDEAEFAFQSVVDPYARADFFVSLGKDPVTGRLGAGLEEGYITTLSLPWHLQLKAGKFRNSLGRINTIHPHALSFINTPVAFENYFGDVLNSEGFSLSWLLPNRIFYQELTFQFTDIPDDNPSFERNPGKSWLKLVHLKNFFDLNDNATLEAGLTGISGKNLFDRTTNLAAADLTYKWKPVRFNTYKSFTWQTEAWVSSADTLNRTAVNTFGLYSLVNFQVSKRWLVNAMFSYSNKPFSSRTKESSYSTTVGWYATEFQKIEIEGREILSNVRKNFFQLNLRWIFVIGTHGAHTY